MRAMTGRIRVVIAKPGLDGHDRGAKVIASSLKDVLVLVGGTIPAPDADALREQGVAAVFTPGTPTTAIVEYLQAHAATG